MKTLITYRARRVLAIAFFAVSAFTSAAKPSPIDPAAERLATNGTIPVSSATRYVERGTFRVQVATKLGRPDAVLRDGTWLYHGRRIDKSDATGTLVVQFEGGRVGSLTLVTRSVATALLENSRRDRNGSIVATK